MASTTLNQNQWTQIYIGGSSLVDQQFQVTGGKALISLGTPSDATTAIDSAAFDDKLIYAPAATSVFARLNGTPAATVTWGDFGAGSSAAGYELLKTGLPPALASLTASQLRNVGAAFAHRLIANRGGLASANRNIANASSNTQVGDQLAIQIMQDVSGISFRLGNFHATSASATDLSGLSAVTWRGGIYDGSQYFPVFSSGGQRDILIQPGAIVETAPVPIALKKGQSIALITLKTWATAPASFPGNPVPAGSARDLSEAGTALTDRTLTGGFTAGQRVGGGFYSILPPLAVLGTGARTPAVAVLGDSIGSEGISDFTSGRGEYGYMQRGLAAAGIPSITLGQASLKLSSVVASRRILGQFLAPCLRIGITHLALALGTNDFADGRTAAAIYADYQKVRDFLAPLGIKTVLYTLPPKTNAANNAQFGTETTTWAQRRILNDMIRTNNGLGDGYFDLAAAWQDPANIDLWRSDLLGVSSFTIANGGSGYYINDLIELSNGAIMRADALSGTTITSASIRGGGFGAFLAAPTAPILAQNAQNFDASWPATAGSGFAINVTGTTAAVATIDGVHPTIGTSAFAMQLHRDRAAALYA